MPLIGTYNDPGCNYRDCKAVMIEIESFAGADIPSDR